MSPLFPELIGRSNEESLIDQAISNGKVHHAWLFVGPRGLGKSTFAFAIAAKILSSGSSLPLSLHQDKITNESHLDFRYISVFDGDKDIKIEQIRELREFLSYKAIESRYRVVIIDSINDLNNKAANALLKSLEEPAPNTVILLVCHSLGSILPTIRSRCITLNFSKFSRADFTAIARANGSEFDSFELNDIFDLCGGTLRVLDLLKTRDDMTFITEIQKLANGELQHLVDIAKAAQDDHTWELIKYFLPFFMHERIITRSQCSHDDFSKLELFNKQLPAIDNSYLDRYHAFKSLFI